MRKYTIGGLMYKNNLKKVRKANRLTQDNIAKLLNCSRSAYNNWERKVNMLSLDIADQLSIFFNVSLSYLLGLKLYETTNNKINPMNYNPLLRNLEQLKGLHGHTYEDIIKYLKCQVRTCQRYFNGNYKIPLELLSKLYSIDLDTLCGKIENHLTYT